MAAFPTGVENLGGVEGSSKFDGRRPKLFLGIISWKGASRFNREGGCFSDGRGFIFRGGFDGGFRKKS